MQNIIDRILFTQGRTFRIERAQILVNGLLSKARARTRRLFGRVYLFYLSNEAGFDAWKWRSLQVVLNIVRFIPQRIRRRLKRVGNRRVGRGPSQLKMIVVQVVRGQIRAGRIIIIIIKPTPTVHRVHARIRRALVRVLLLVQTIALVRQFLLQRVQIPSFRLVVVVDRQI